MQTIINNIKAFFNYLFSPTLSTTSKPKFPLGAIPNIPDNRDIAYPFTGLVGNSFPASFGVEAAVTTPRLLQGGESACVPYSFEFDKRSNDNILHSRRFMYALTQQNLGLTSPGLPQREAAKVATTVGMTRDAGYDDTTLPESSYRGLAITPSMIAEANMYRFGGFAFPAINVNAFKQALLDGKIIHVTVAIDWSTIEADGTLHAPITIDGYHEVAVYWDQNQHFSCANWWGYDLYIPEAELNKIVIDAIVFAEIPEDLKLRAKQMTYVFQTDLKIGVTSPAVAQLQARLTQYGLFNHSITNYFGTVTQEAVIAYQKMKGISPTGNFGPLTRASMNNDAGNGQVGATVVAPITTANQIPAIDEKFLHAIVMQESRGNLGAIGDLDIDAAHGGHAYGPMQIRQPDCDDVNKRFGSSLLATQMLNNLELSEDTFTKYMHIYFPNGGTFEEMARLWNAGPNWRNEMSATNGYWAGVQSYLS